MNAGDTILVANPGSRFDKHLWVVLSDPAIDPERILIVNVTSHKPHHDQTCLLEAGEHPWLKWRSCIMYEGARVTSIADCDRVIKSGHVEFREPVSPELLQRIRDGAATTDRISLAHQRLLVDQGLIPAI